MEYSLGSLRLFSHILPRLLANVVRIQLLPYRFTAPVWGAGGAGGPSEGGVGKMDSVLIIMVGETPMLFKMRCISSLINKPEYIQYILLVYQQFIKINGYGPFAM